MIRISGLCKSFGDLQVLRNLALDVRKGESIVVIGPSGGGKSTFLRCLNGLEPFEAGEVHVCDIALHGISHHRPKKEDREAIRRVRMKAGMVFQQFNLFPHLTVLENVIEAPIQILGRSKNQAIEEAMALLTKVNMAHKRDSYPIKLSGGQQQRVAIARALAMRPVIMLFDEPTSALDPEMVGEVLTVIRNLVYEEGMTSLIATHEMAFAKDVADRIIVLDHEIIEIDTPERIFSNAQSERTRSFLNRVRV